MTMTDPYRAPQDDEARMLVAERELVIDTPSQSRRNAFMRMIAAVCAVSAAAIVLVHNAMLALVVVGVAIVYSVWHAARIGARGRIVFRIAQDALVVVRAHSEESIPLHTLDDVELETREVRKVGPDANPIAGLSFNQRVGPAVDVARVVIMRRKQPPMRLGDEWIAHGDATESFRKLRLFLRARGWLPRSERKKTKGALA